MIVTARFINGDYKRFEDVSVAQKDVAFVNDAIADVIRLIYNKGGDTYFPISCLYSITEDKQ